MATERRELHLQNRDQTPDQHPLEDVHRVARIFLDHYTSDRAINGAINSRIIWPDGSETYSKRPDGSRGLIANFTGFFLEVTERIVANGDKLDGKVSTDGNLPVTALEKIVYSDSEFNLKDSVEASEHAYTSMLERFPRRRLA